MKNYLFLNLIFYMPKKPEVIKHVTREELEDMYKREKNSRIKERLLAILHLYEGKNIPEVSKIIKRSESSIKRWLKRWNKEGYNGLIPELKGGPIPKLPDSEWDKILKEIEEKGMTIKDVKIYIKTTRGVEYSYNMVWHVLRKKKKVRYGKPYIQNSKRPENAEEILKKE
jgi:putative transposase